MEILLLFCFAISFLITFLAIPYWIKKAKKIDLTGKDMNKFNKPAVAEAGGVIVIMGVIFGILFYIFIQTFYFKAEAYLIQIFAVLATILLAGFIGFVDDILGWKTGLRQLHKVLLTVPIAIPLAVINAGNSVMSLPFLGPIDFGIIFPLLIVPIGIIGATNAFNMLGGYNSLEALMGIIILAFLGLIAYLTNMSWIAMLAFCMVFALLAFLKYNWIPAKIFPGDSLTYSTGALIACVAILGNMEKIVLILFLLYFLDAVLFIKYKFIDKVRGVEAFAKVNKDDSLDLPYDKIYDTTHLVIKIVKKIKPKCFEKDVVLFIVSFEFLLAIVIFILWNSGML